jgi:hypothetical protein
METRARRNRLLDPLLWLPLLGLITVLTVYFVLPVEHVGVVGIRLLFDGADRGRYPNGIPFSDEEIISRPTLKRLYDGGFADRGPFDAFASSFFVVRSTRDLQLVNQAYGAQLADTRLSPVDRARIESEYRARLESTGREPELLLGLRQPFADKPLSDDEMQALLDAALKEWVRAAEEVQGALRYDIDVVGGDVVERGGQVQREVLIRLDALRVALRRELQTIDRMATQPGFAGVVLPGDNLSTDGVRAEVTDLLELRVQPLMRLALTRGVRESQDEVVTYFDARLAHASRRRASLAQQVSGLREALQDYAGRAEAAVASGSGAARDGTTLMPQMSDDFLDKLFAAAGAANDLQFRQRLTDDIVELDLQLAQAGREEAYYQQLLAAVKGMPPRGGDGAGPLGGEIEAMEAAAAASARLTQRLYEEVSRLSLGAHQGFYQVSREFELRTNRSMSETRLALACLVAFLVCIIVAWGLRHRQRWWTWASWRRLVLNRLAPANMSRGRPSLSDAAADASALGGQPRDR